MSLISLIPVLVIASAMEALDLFDDFRSLGYLNWSNSIHDLINTCFWPVLIYLIVQFKSKKSKYV